MKRIVLSILLTIGVMAWGAGDIVVYPLTLTNISTSSTNTVAITTEKITGYVLGIYFDKTGTATSTVTVATTTTNIAGTTISSFPVTTLFTETGQQADGWHDVRRGAVTTADAAISDSHVPIFLLAAPIQISGVSATAVSNNITAKIYVEKN